MEKENKSSLKRTIVTVTLAAACAVGVFYAGVYKERQDMGVELVKQGYIQIGAHSKDSNVKFQDATIKGTYVNENKKYGYLQIGAESINPKSSFQAVTIKGKYTRIKDIKKSKENKNGTGNNCANSEQY